MQNKAYSRDWLVRGRLRVQLKDASGNPIHADIPTRKLLVHSNKTCRPVTMFQWSYHFSVRCETWNERMCTV